jgi:hypothetical protein
MESPETGVGLLRATAAEAESTGATQVVTVARIALVSALTRLGRHDQTLALFPPLLHQARRKATGPAVNGAAHPRRTPRRPRPAEDSSGAFAAARESPSAPAVSGQDMERYRRLEELISQRTSPDVLDQITARPAHCHAPKSSTALAALDGPAS